MLVHPSFTRIITVGRSDGAIDLLLPGRLPKATNSAASHRAICAHQYLFVMEKLQKQLAAVGATWSGCHLIAACTLPGIAKLRAVTQDPSISSGHRKSTAHLPAP